MLSQVHTDRAVLRVFGIPELAHLICSVIQRYDNVSLMQTCRQLFHNILPFVWEQVDQADALISMIPGGGTVTHNSDLLPYVVMQLPSCLDLTRFNIYAPYVKRFSPSTPYVDEYAGWESFLSCVRSIDLLPNLETVYLPVRDHNEYSNGDVKAIDVDCINWVTAFLSSSLRTLQLGYRKRGFYWNNRGAPWMDFSLFDSLMVVVFQKCSGLRSLSILPASVRHDEGYARFSQLLFSRVNPQAYLNFLQLKNLSSLLVSSAILNLDALVTLSVLPSLETLCIHGSDLDRYISCEGLELPIEAFPALKHLELIAQTWANIGNLCSAKPIVLGLHSLTIEYPSYQSEGRYHSLHDIIPLLAVNNSSIATLVLLGFRTTLVPPGVLQSWRQLPLIDLHLEWSFDTDQAFSMLSSIISCLPLLEVLKLSMAESIFDLRELRTIVEHLPRLRHLRAPLEEGSVTEFVEGDFTPCRSQSNETLYLESNFYLPTPQQENAERLARYLSTFRPSATVICQSYESHFYSYAGGSYVDESPKNMLNAELARLRLR